MLRLRFEKTGNGIWISHLDLMRVFQRAFRRAGLSLKHTQGFNPHAFVSIALPLPVGMMSRCELLEFALEAPAPLPALPARLNAVLPAGIRCLEAYEGERKLRDLVWLRTQTILEYDGGIPDGLLPALNTLFAMEKLRVEKKTKSGVGLIDIKPMLHELTPRLLDGNTAALEAVVQAQNPPLNPNLLTRAVEICLPHLAPSFAKSARLELYTADFQVFR